MDYKILNPTQNLKNDHITIRRVKDIAGKCSNLLYSNQYVPIEDMEIMSVIIEEFIDNFHHGKEEKAYFPQTKDKNGFAEDIRKFLIEHELGRRIAMMLRKELKELKENIRKDERGNVIIINSNQKKNVSIYEPVARFLKSYAVFIEDHIGKEDKFFDLIYDKNKLSTEEEERLLNHYMLCGNQAGGEDKIKELLRLIEYLEERDWMKDKYKK
ncbi:MAG: hemerythrin domain-containing protein [Candidatus Nitrosocosmicus sp.]